MEVDMLSRKLVMLADIGVDNWASRYGEGLPKAEEEIGDLLDLPAASIKAMRKGQVERIKPVQAVKFAQVVYERTYVSYRWVHDFLDLAGVPEFGKHFI